MKVAIWGSYNHGNYGDDLMGIQFATILKNMGVKPCVYRLDENVARKYSIESTQCINECFKDASFGIIGGGGMLVGAKSYKRGEKLSGYNLENDFYELNLAISKYNCNLFPVSIGGDGRGGATPLSFWQNELFNSSYCNKSTVRLKEDVQLIKRLGKVTDYYPDILLGISSLWNILPQKKQSKQLHVGINIYSSFSNIVLSWQLSVIAAIRKDIVFHFIRTHLPRYNTNYELLPKIDSPYIRHYIYTDPISTLEFLKSLDLLVSSKLHLGLTALALNVPFISYRGQGKTQTFLKSLNADFAIFSKQETYNLKNIICNPSKIENMKHKYDFSLIEKMKQKSQGHIEFMKTIINSY